MQIPLVRVAALTCLFLVSSEISAQEVRPRYRFEVGAVHRYRLIEDQAIENSLAPAAESQRMERVYRFTVRDVDSAARTASLEVRTESIQLSASGGPVRETYDSTREDNNPASPTTKMNDAMLAQTLRITLSDRGEIIAFRGVDVEAILRAAFGDVAGSEFFQRELEQVRESLGDDNMKTIFQRMFVELPDSELTPDDSWQHQVVMSLPVFGPMQVSTSYQYIGVERKDDRRVAQIRLDQTYERQESGPLVAGGVQLLVEGLESKGNGLVSFDLEAGRIHRFTLERQESGTLRPAESQPGGLPPAHIKTTTRSTLELLGQSQ